MFCYVSWGNTAVNRKWAIQRISVRNCGQRGCWVRSPTGIGLAYPDAYSGEPDGGGSFAFGLKRLGKSGMWLLARCSGMKYIWTDVIPF